MDDNVEHIIVVNLLTMECFHLLDSQLTADRIRTHLKPSVFGLTLNDKYILKMMGKQKAGEYLR